MARFVSDIFPPASSRSALGDAEASTASKRQSPLLQAGVLLLEQGKTHLQRQEQASEHPRDGGCSSCSGRTCCPCPRPAFPWQTVARPQRRREQSQPGAGEPGAKAGMLPGGLEVVPVHPSREGSGTSCAKRAGEERTRSACPLPMDNDGDSRDQTSTRRAKPCTTLSLNQPLTRQREGDC